MSVPIVTVSAVATDVGNRRELNEDAALAAAPVFVVADGMGGHEAGELASAAVVTEFQRYVGRDSLSLDDVREAIANCRLAVDAADETGEGRAGTTLTGAAVSDVDGIGYWLVFNIGDSRTYRFADNELEQITVDHSVVQELIDAGELTAEAASQDRRKNVITRAIGAGSVSEADFWLFPAEARDRMVICSDGLHAELGDARIAEVLRHEADPQHAANVLVQEAVEAGGRDNVTVIILDAVLVTVRRGSPVMAEEPEFEDTVPRTLMEGVG